jgi:solute carrier family 25 (mitochondrial carnitine/acylcarnitine transporter), member 20/29
MNEISAGFCAGITQTIVGHPLDTIKVLIQNNKQFNKFKFINFYKGWRYPMVMSTLFNATLFPVNEKLYSYTNNFFASGFISGIIVSPIVYCFDIGKIKEQTNQKIMFNTFYKTPGLFTTAMRESMAVSVYMGSYHVCKDKYNIDPFFAGGIAGILNWVFTYPLDVVRTRQMAQDISIKEAFDQKNLWKGFNICILRAAIVNASIFKVYEIVKSQQKNYELS